MIQCPECNSLLVLASELELWDRVYCNSCGAELEIVNEYPIELEAVFDFDDEVDVDDLLDEAISEDWEEDQDKKKQEEEELDEDWENELDEDW